MSILELPKPLTSRNEPPLSVLGALDKFENTAAAADPNGQVDALPDAAHPSPTAASALLAGDDRNRRIITNEHFTSIRKECSHARKCVLLAAAKLSYEQAHPEARQGGAAGKAGGGKVARTKSPDSEAFVTIASRATGIKKTKIYRCLQVGSGLSESAYNLLLGTNLANKVGALEQLALLPEPQQVEVAKDFSVTLERQAMSKLRAYSDALRATSTPKSLVENDVQPRAEGEVADGQDAARWTDADAGWLPPTPTALTVTLRPDEGDVVRIGDFLVLLEVRSTSKGEVVIDLHYLNANDVE